MATPALLSSAAVLWEKVVVNGFMRKLPLRFIK